MSTGVDFLIVGAGITGLALAWQLSTRLPSASILVVEKEKRLGAHASGRNSGVLHSGIYYPKTSLKAKYCNQGSLRLAEYCDERGLSVQRVGKVIVPTTIAEDATLDLLLERGRHNGAVVELIDGKDLAEIEPLVRSASGRALYSPNTAVFNPTQILDALRDDLEKRRVRFSWGQRLAEIDPNRRECRVGEKTLVYGHLFNAAGAFAHELAAPFGLADDFVMIPFKGLYYTIDPTCPVRFKGLIYPVPDLGMPFLGIHTVKGIDGTDRIGPSAAPALGPENYDGLEGANWRDSMRNFGILSRHYLGGAQGFRAYAHREVAQWSRRGFARAVKAMVPSFEAEYVSGSPTCGIRAQLFDRKSKRLEMDFLVRHEDASTHVLNVVSPGFTSAMSFTEEVVEAALNG